MIRDCDQIEWHTARLHGYTLFQSVFGTKPTEEMLRIAHGGVTSLAFAIMEEPVDTSSIEHTRLHSAHRALERLLESRDGAGFLQQLRGEYTKLLIGPGKLPAPPWESAYVSSRKLLFQQETLAVRLAYRSEGFLAVEYPHVADDHLSLELDFMANLCGKTRDALERNDEKEATRLLSAQRAFLTEHLLAWIREFSDALARSEGVSDFYPTMARLLCAFLELDDAALASLDAECA